MRAWLLAILAMPAFGEEPQASADAAVPSELAVPARTDATAGAESDSARPELAAADAPKAAEPPKVYLPPGFKVKKRGKFTLYCRKEEAMGTRFPVEKCYDEQGIRDYVLDQRENQKQVDQMRRVCGSMEACGGGG